MVLVLAQNQRGIKMPKYELKTVADAIVTLTYHVEANSEEEVKQMLEDGNLPATQDSDWSITEFGNGEEIVQIQIL